MELLDAHGRALGTFDRLVRRVGPDQWADPTPCRDWSVRELVNHLVSEQLWVPALLNGATTDDVGDRFDGDVLGDDPVGRWQSAAEAARDAWLRPGALEREVHLSQGPAPAAEYGWQMTLDLAVHAWDLAMGLGEPSPLEKDVAAELLDVFEPEIPKWRSSGLFGSPVPVPADADAPARLLGLLGRRP